MEEVADVCSNLKFHIDGLEDCRDFDSKIEWLYKYLIDMKDPIDFLGYHGCPKLPVEAMETDFLHHLRDLGFDDQDFADGFDMDKMEEMVKADLKRFIPGDLLEASSRRARQNALKTVYNRVSDSLREELRINGVSLDRLDGAVLQGLRKLAEKIRVDIVDNAADPSKAEVSIAQYFVKLAQEEAADIEGRRPGSSRFSNDKSDLLSDFLSKEKGLKSKHSFLKGLKQKNSALKGLSEVEVIDQIKMRLEFFEYVSQRELEQKISDVISGKSLENSSDSELDPLEFSEILRRHNEVLLRWLQRNMRYSLHSCRKLLPFVTELYFEVEKHTKLRGMVIKSDLHKLWLKHDIRLTTICRAASTAGPHTVFALLHGKNNVDDLEYALLDKTNVDYELYKTRKDLYDASLAAGMGDPEPEYLSKQFASAWNERIYLDRHLIKKHWKKVIDARERRRAAFLENPRNKEELELFDRRMSVLKEWLEQTGGFENFTPAMQKEVETWANEASRSSAQKDVHSLAQNMPIESLNHLTQLAFRKIGALNWDENGRFVRDRVLEFADENYGKFMGRKEDRQIRKSLLAPFLYYAISPDGKVVPQAHFEKDDIGDILDPMDPLNREDTKDERNEFHELANSFIKEDLKILEMKKFFEDMNHKENQDSVIQEMLAKKIENKFAKKWRPIRTVSGSMQFVSTIDQWSDLTIMPDMPYSERKQGSEIYGFDPVYSYERFCFVRDFGFFHTDMGDIWKIYNTYPEFAHVPKTPVDWKYMGHHSGIEFNFTTSQIDDYVDYFLDHGKLDRESPLFGAMLVKDVRKLAKARYMERIRVKSEQVDVGISELSGSSEFTPRLEKDYVDMTIGRHSLNKRTQDSVFLYDDADNKGQFTKNNHELSKVDFVEYEDTLEDWQWDAMTRQAYQLEHEGGGYYTEGLRQLANSEMFLSDKAEFDEVFVNEEREKSFLLSNATKEAIWREYLKDPIKNTQWELAKKYNLRADRIDAILRLKHMEKTEFAHEEPFDIVETGDGILYGVDYQKLMENFYLPVRNAVDKIGVDYEGRPSTYTAWQPLYTLEEEDLPEHGPGSGELIETATEAAAKGQIPNRHGILISDLDEVKSRGIVKVTVRNQDGSLRQPFKDEFVQAVRNERPFSKRTLKKIKQEKAAAIARGEEYVPHPSLKVIE
eukprot:TRINITY_DN7248_c0_g4_i1.p1 TRINITY_DN7248_c0_g4~~TRINITY_DN7248_c0_g4_i1.p1  ORF type:complete len:1194 (+),score=332.81 TRINITY_DN7248_c0_g4_i1:75-3584(+)